ncbi:anti-sigma factor family protein [Candidatus Zixiibacteriota bacterium]
MKPPHDSSGVVPTDGKACDDYREDLVRFVDGELHGEDLKKFEQHIEVCTECRREVSVFQSLKGELQAMGMKQPDIPGGSVWNDVNRKVARPIGWIFTIIGFVMYLAYAIYIFVSSTGNLFEKLAIGLLVTGFVVLLATVAWERIVDYRTDPYKGVEK